MKNHLECYFFNSIASLTTCIRKYNIYIKIERKIIRLSYFKDYCDYKFIYGIDIVRVSLKIVAWCGYFKDLLSWIQRSIFLLFHLLFRKIFLFLPPLVFAFLSWQNIFLWGIFEIPFPSLPLLNCSLVPPFPLFLFLVVLKRKRKHIVQSMKRQSCKEHK